MASRFFVWLFKIGDDYVPGKTVVIKRASDSAIVAMTGTGHGYLEIVDNGNGLYYVDGLPSDKYNVYVNGVIHTEMEGYFFAADNIKSHMDNNTIHFVIDDVGTGNSVVLSAEKVYALLEDKMDVSDISEITDAIDSINAALADKASATPGSGLKAEDDDKLGLNYNEDYFGINSSGKLTLNADTIQALTKRRVIYADHSYSEGSGAAALPSYIHSSPGEAIKVRAALNRRVGDTKVRLSCKAAISVGYDPAAIVFKLPDYSIESELTVVNGTYQNKHIELTLPVDLDPDLLEVQVILKIEVGASTEIYMSHVTIEAY